MANQGFLDTLYEYYCYKFEPASDPGNCTSSILVIRRRHVHAIHVKEHLQGCHLDKMRREGLQELVETTTKRRR
jgi:hypothetical protein